MPGRPARARVLGLAIDHREHLAAQRHRRDQQILVVGDLRKAGERVEELRHVGAEFAAAREEAQIGVEARGLLVVVAGAEVHVAPNAVFFLPHDHQRLGVHFLAGESVDDVRARALQAPRPFDVVLFVEARFELDDDGNLFFVLRRFEQRAHDRRVLARGAVERRLDREHLLVFGGLLQELHDRIERFVRDDAAGCRLRESARR